MKIAYITSSLQKCGPNLVLNNIISALSVTEQKQVKIFYLDVSCSDCFESVEKVKIESLKMLEDELFEFDIVHSNGLRPDTICAFLKLKFKLKGKKLNICTTIHNYVFQDLFFSHGLFKSIIFGSLWCLSWLLFSKIAVLSDNAKKYYWFLPDKKLKVISNGVSVNLRNTIPNYSLRNKFSIQSDAILLGSCANLTARKGLDIVIRNLKKNNKLHFIIAGDGIEKNALIKLSRDLKVNDRVHFVPFQDDAMTFMVQLDIFMMPSRSEGFGLTVIEAAQLNVPVITSNIPIFKELFSDMVRMFDLENPDSLLPEIEFTYKNRLQLAELGRNVAMFKYNSEVMAKKYIHLYKILKSGE